MPLVEKLSEYLRYGIDSILPPRCVVNGAPVEQQGMVSPGAWKKLDFITKPYCACCGMPFEFEVEEGTICANCLDHLPPFVTARAALKYNDGCKDLILGFKHADKTHAVKAFTPWLLRAGESMLAEADYLIPVPLHRWRLLKRRYNQAALIAQELAKYSDPTFFPEALARVRSTVSQGHLSNDERHKNVKRAFAVPEKYKNTLKGKKIVLIDDVYTTGATLEECTKVLKRAGAHEIHALTLARVVRG